MPHARKLARRKTTGAIYQTNAALGQSLAARWTNSRGSWPQAPAIQGAVASVAEPLKIGIAAEPAETFILTISARTMADTWHRHSHRLIDMDY
jgi:hypothetical protein